jgi:hypothetical protein
VEHEIDRAVTFEREVNAVGPVSGSRPATRDELAEKSERTMKLTTGGKDHRRAAMIQIGPDTYRYQVVIETSSVVFAAGAKGAVR